MRTPVVVTKSSVVVHRQTMLSISLINEAAYNPRKIAPSKFAGLKRSIRTYGFIEPLAVRKATNGLIGGHQRLKAVREVCAEDRTPLPLKLPVVLLDVDERTAKKLNVALNNLGGDFDQKKLAELLININSEGPVMPDERELMGFSELQFADYLSFNDPLQPDPDPKPFAKGPSCSLIFATAEHRDLTREMLKKRAEQERIHPGEVVYRLLGGKDDVN